MVVLHPHAYRVGAAAGLGLPAKARWSTVDLFGSARAGHGASYQTRLKRYGVAHLVRLLRIQRLTDLGFSLAQIAEMGAADEHPGKAFRTPDADLASTIERLKRVLSPSAITAYKDMLEGCDTDPALVEFDRLPADADERTRAGLARRMVPHARELYTRYPGCSR